MVMGGGCKQSPSNGGCMKTKTQKDSWWWQVCRESHVHRKIHDDKSHMVMEGCRGVQGFVIAYHIGFGDNRLTMLLKPIIYILIDFLLIIIFLTQVLTHNVCIIITSPCQLPCHLVTNSCAPNMNNVNYLHV
jgi:hypothetical protein